MDWQQLQCEAYYSHLRSVRRIGEPHLSTGAFTNPLSTSFFSGTLLVLTVLQLVKSTSLHDDIRKMLKNRLYS
jgi:hypothetical protein